jgi:hypothetical protein
VAPAGGRSVTLPLGKGQSEKIIACPLPVSFSSKTRHLELAQHVAVPGRTRRADSLTAAALGSASAC